MSIDYLTLPEAARQLDASGHKISTQSLWRWCAYGCRGVTLEHGRFGRRYVVRMADLNDFITALGKLDQQPTQHITQRKHRTGQDDPERLSKAQTRLKEMGV